MYVLKAMANVLKKISCFFGEVALLLLSLSLVVVGAVGLVFGVGYIIGTLIPRDGIVLAKGVDWFFVNIGIVEMFLLPILLFALSVCKEYKRLIQKDAEECCASYYKKALVALIEVLMKMHNENWDEKTCENLSVEELEKEVLKRKETCDKYDFFFQAGRACEYVKQMVDENESDVCTEQLERFSRFVWS